MQISQNQNETMNKTVGMAKNDFSFYARYTFVETPMTAVSVIVSIFSAQ